MLVLSKLIGTLQHVFHIGSVGLHDVSGALVVRNGDDTADATIKASSITLSAGASDGRVLTSDASGNASWQEASGGGGVVVNRKLTSALSIGDGECAIFSEYIELQEGASVSVSGDGVLEVI